MKLKYLGPLLALFLAGGFTLLQPLNADTSSAPFALGKAYSAKLIITQKDGSATTTKIFVDDGKIRLEPNNQTVQIISIVRPDQEKFYSVMTSQKTVMESPFENGRPPKILPTIPSSGSKFEKVGPDSVQDVACTKYRITGPDGSISYLWVDEARQTPVKLVSEDSSYEVQWKDYQVGPQDAALFEPPTEYKVMNMPANT